MLKSVGDFKTLPVEHLLKLWQQRYTKDLSCLYSEDFSTYSLVLRAALPEGRISTATNLKNQILNINSPMIWIQTKKLYGYIPSVLDINEARRIAEFGFRLYDKLLKIYQQQSFQDTFLSLNSEMREASPNLNIPEIDFLVSELEPVLKIFKEQHFVCKNSHCLSFMSTQLHFTNRLILNHLNPAEKLLLEPYLTFVEEYVTIPWHRVCLAAAKYRLNSPEINIMKQMFPVTSLISESVYCQLLESLPNYQSHSGDLHQPDIRLSCERDLNMFQAYIWLCMLEKNLAPVETEMLPMCMVLVENLNIPWEFTCKWCELLISTLENCVRPEYKNLLRSYTQGVKNLFLQKRDNLGYGYTSGNYRSR
ncbi:hypothetical protein [Mastigocoleus testarum]|uniref:Uncharacterized protein n=1 Tax=Mastigocoleus testarum BC008 TaxID=371196 RepID=A0A0V7ZD41_9CYAN|nr:hypothetical protein [Mastigocoleus testarum]KST62381.1 hypothetical protein BC008_09430 [Mastigocoleus testarum BC008]